MSSGLLNLYREIEAGKVEVVVAPEPEPDVPGLDIYFGPEPGWEPYLEGATVDLATTAPDGKPCKMVVCWLCYGGETTPDPLPYSMVCGACGRSHLDARIAKLLAQYPPPAPG